MRGDAREPVDSIGPGDRAGENTTLSLRLALALASKIKIGSLDILCPDGSTRSFAGAVPGPHGIIRVHRARLGRRMFLGGNVGLAEAYMDGDWDSPSLPDFLTVGALNSDAFDETLRGSLVYRTIDKMAHHWNRNSPRGSRRNIAYHYDLGNKFYEQWLDPTMTYSSAEFEGPAEDLPSAQSRKYERLADRIGVADGQHVLEIGCGWGGFAEHVAKSRGARVTGITISREQHDYARERIQREGLNEKVDIRLVDYRDVDGRYDGIASIEMFEAVGEQYWPAFFTTVRDRLREGGRAALQIITIADRHFDFYRSRPDFIQRYIFPGGMLPSPGRLVREIKETGLRFDGMEGFGQSYAQTLNRWNDRFQDAWDRIQTMGFDTRFKRMWEYYLAYCEAGFRAGSIDVNRVTLTKI